MSTSKSEYFNDWMRENERAVTRKLAVDTINDIKDAELARAV